MTQAQTSTPEAKKRRLEDALAERKALVMDYLAGDRRKSSFVPEDIHDAVYSYLLAGGKVLRPSVLMFSCGAVGGDEKQAIPAAVAVELFHTWTLVHDDIIDRDAIRRGQPTVHEAFRRRALERAAYNAEDAQHYGLSIGLMTAELQHGWAVSLLTELYNRKNTEVVLTLIKRLETDVLLALVGGQTLDIQYSKAPVGSLTEKMILDVLWRKTGALYQFAGMAGAMIGLNTPDDRHPFVEALSTFTGQCGLAFQLQDDILGVIGNEQTLGKPVGSDLREGKRTIVLSYAFQHASPAERRFLMDVLGNPEASDADLQEVTSLLQSLGGIEYARTLAQRYIDNAMTNLDKLPASIHKDLLASWAEYMIGRTF